jgi:hypothetical protein
LYLGQASCSLTFLSSWLCVCSLTYSYDSQHLYASTDNGSVVIWGGSAAKGGSKTPKFLNLTTLI